MTAASLRLLVLGRGRTGALVGEVARERGHSVRALGAAENEDARALTPERLREIDVVIDFTTPEAVLPNITACARAGAQMVVGTTGWHTHAPKVRELVEATGIGFVYGSNFSVGVNLFFEVARAAAAALPLGYTARIMERHHAEKKDSRMAWVISSAQALLAR